MLQLFVVLYVPGLLFAMPISSRFTAAVIAFVINYAAYFSEIYRGGIESVSRGQYEAGQVLGMTKTQIFFKIILLQVIKRIIPPLSNEVITLTKDTSLARVIALAEIIMCAERYTKQGLIWHCLLQHYISLFSMVSLQFYLDGSKRKWITLEYKEGF